MRSSQCDVACRARVLIVEDNADLAFGLRVNLELEGYEVVSAEDGVTALALAAHAGPDVMLLDLMLPQLDGFAVIRALRAAGSTLPIIVLSAKTEEVDIVAALKLGADDYVPKPFSLLVLIERVRKQVERSFSGPKRIGARQEIRIGDAVVDVEGRVVKRDSRELPLRPKEFELLLFLWNSVGLVVSKNELLKAVWGFPAQVMTRTVDFHVDRLRQIIEPEPSRPRHLITVRGVGYRLVA